MHKHNIHTYSIQAFLAEMNLSTCSILFKINTSMGVLYTPLRIWLLYNFLNIAEIYLYIVHDDFGVMFRRWTHRTAAVWVIVVIELCRNRQAGAGLLAWKLIVAHACGGGRVAMRQRKENTACVTVCD